MPDGVDRFLASLGHSGRGPSEPPPAFLAAVARRRHRRRMTQAGVGAGLLAVVVGISALLRSTPGPALPGAPGGAVRMVSLPEPPLGSVGQLARLNPDSDPERLELPLAGGAGGAEALYVGLRPDSPQVERWIAQ